MPHITDELDANDPLQALGAGTLPTGSSRASCEGCRGSYQSDAPGTLAVTSGHI